MFVSSIVFSMVIVAFNSSKLGSAEALDDYIQKNLVEASEFSMSLEQTEFLYDEFTQIYEKEKNFEGLTAFSKNLQTIVEHNRAGRDWTMGVNKFADVSFTDFKKDYLWNEPQNCSATKGTYSFKNLDLPEHVDWRDSGKVSPVKNQGHCGSCWTFSTTGTLEAHYKIYKGGPFLDLAKQQLVDCAQEFDNHGCNGGLPSHAFEYIKHVGGIMSEHDYAYKAVEGTCKFDKTQAAAFVWGGSVNITAGNEDELDEALWSAGPVSICFQVIDEFRFYKEGVYSSPDCKNTAMDVNHAVVAVGYGVKDGKQYYIVKNSWGPEWGNQGFFWIERGVNMCGVAQCNSYPKLYGSGKKVQEI